MSHTSTVSNVEIRDVDAIRAAVRELRQRGVSITLEENTIPRAYYNNQQGLDKAADFVLKLNNSRYDVGLYKTDKGNYELRADFFNGEIERNIGCEDSEVESYEQKQCGKFINLYATHATINAAIQQGYQVNRIDSPDGSVQLQLIAA